MSIKAILAILLVSLASACATNTAINDGAGYELLKPKPETVAYIKDNDVPFLRSVAGHNRQCKSDDACRK